MSAYLRRRGERRLLVRRVARSGIARGYAFDRAAGLSNRNRLHGLRILGIINETRTSIDRVALGACMGNSKTAGKGALFLTILASLVALHFWGCSSGEAPSKDSTGGGGGGGGSGSVTPPPTTPPPVVGGISFTNATDSNGPKVR